LLSGQFVKEPLFQVRLSF